jgi:hypothetical protein
LDRDYSRSIAVLIGTSEYTNLPNVPAAANSLKRMQGLLASQLCGWPASRMKVIRNRRKPGDLPDLLVQIFAEVTDIALFYYVGHGQIDDRDELSLSLVDSRTEAERRATTSLPFGAVRYALNASNAKTKIVILDCCFAGLAVGTQGILSTSPKVIEMTHGTGAYTLAASGMYNTAWFEHDPSTSMPQTYFTKHFVEVIERGIAEEPAVLSLNAIYARLEDDLAANQKPAPTRRIRGSADRFPFARNITHDRSRSTLHDEPLQEAAKPAPKAAPQLRRDSLRTTVLLNELERIARAIEESSERASAMVYVASVVARLDPSNAVRLLDDAQHPTQRDQSQYGGRRRATPPLEYLVSSSITEIFKVVSFVDSTIAKQVLDEVEKSVLSVTETSTLYTSKPTFPDILAQFVESMASVDVTRAEQIARTITDEYFRTEILTKIAIVVAHTNPVRGEQLVRAIFDRPKGIHFFNKRSQNDIWRNLEGEWAMSLFLVPASDLKIFWKTRALIKVAVLMAFADPVRSEAVDTDDNQLSRKATPTSHRRLSSAAKVATAVRSDPARPSTLLAEAEQLARTIIATKDLRALALTEISMAAARIDPTRALQLLAEAEQFARTITHQDFRADALTDIATAAARIDPVRAEQIARSLVTQAHLLAKVALALARPDPSRAKQIASTIDDSYLHSRAMAEIALLTKSANAVPLLRAAEINARGHHARTAEVAMMMARIDPVRAELIARNIADRHQPVEYDRYLDRSRDRHRAEYWRVRVLTDLAEAYLDGTPEDDNA